MAYPKISVATAYQYGPRNWLDTLIATKSGVDLFTQYLIKDVGQITKQLSQHAGSSSFRKDYEYDALGQLTGWVHDSTGGSHYSHKYEYDSVGNRVKQLTLGSSGVTSSWIGYTTGRNGTTGTPNER